MRSEAWGAGRALLIAHHLGGAAILLEDVDPLT
jgi:hypothetical protein